MTFVNSALASECKIVLLYVSPSDKPLVLLNLFNSSTMTPVPCLEVHLSSSLPDGHVCSLIRKSNKFIDKDMEVTFKDGSHVMVKLAFKSKWTSGEYCTASNTLNIRLAQIKGDSNLHPESLSKISIRIYDIQSPYREIYMYKPFCDSQYKLYNGKLKIYDRYPIPSVIRNKTFTPGQYCVIHVLNKPMENPICFNYTIMSKKADGSEWKLYVSPATSYARFLSDVFFSFDKNSFIMDTWCDSTVRNHLTFIFRTTPSRYLDSEPPMFKIVLSTKNTNVHPNGTEVLKNIQNPGSFDVNGGVFRSTLENWINANLKSSFTREYVKQTEATNSIANWIWSPFIQYMVVLLALLASLLCF